MGAKEKASNEAVDMSEKLPYYLNPEEYVNHNPYMKYNHMKVTKISPEESELQIEVNPHALNIMGIVHGGMIYSMADAVTGLTARADGRKYVTQSANINFISNVTSGTVIAKGILLRRGKKVTLMRCVVENEEGRLLAEGTVDMFCLDE